MLEQFLNDPNDFDLGPEFGSYMNRNNNSKLKTNNIEEEPKVLKDINLTVRNNVKENGGDDAENSDASHNRQYKFLWQR